MPNPREPAQHSADLAGEPEAVTDEQIARAVAEAEAGDG